MESITDRCKQMHKVQVNQNPPRLNYRLRIYKCTYYKYSPPTKTYHQPKNTQVLGYMKSNENFSDPIFGDLTLQFELHF